VVSNYQGSSYLLVNAGGLIANRSENASIVESWATGNVSASYKDGAASAYAAQAYLGGLVGYWSSAGSIARSYSLGKVSGDLTRAGNLQHLGGLVGRVNNASGTITDTYSYSPVIYSGTGQAYVGGLVGHNQGTVTTSYAIGYLLNSGGGSSATGGLVASNSGTVTNSYWDTETTGIGTSAGGTARTTAQLQAGLPTGFSGAVWGIIPDETYPFLKALHGTNPEYIKGTARGSDYSPLAGYRVNALIDGDIPQGGFGWSGADGKFYMLMQAGTINNSQQLLYYADEAQKANWFIDNTTGSGDVGDMLGGQLRILSESTTFSAILANLQTAQGAYSGADFLYTNNPASGLTMTGNNNLYTYLAWGAGTIDFDRSITSTGSGYVILTNEEGGTITQSAGVLDVTNLLLRGDGDSDFLLTEANDIVTLVASGNTDTIHVDNGTNNLSIGTINVFGAINGVTGGDRLILEVSGAGVVSQTQLISAGELLLLGAGGTHTLTNTSNAITTLAANTGTVSFLENSGYAIGTVNGVDGLTATNAYLSSTGTVTQSKGISATNLLLQGAAGVYTLTNTGNAITTLAANTGTVNFLENSGYAIGTVNGVNGLTATNAYLSSTGTVTQSQAIAATNLLLSGAAGVYTLTNTSNAITTLAANTGTVNFLENSGYAIGTVNGVNGLTATNAYLSSTGTVTQSQAIAATNLLLQGAAGVYTLTNTGNAITTLA
jgi:hypothetical protein